ncbi:MAG TPA: hypothetical protein PKD53_30835, partial [Chloroflexaceae bacterium]|nr:hypothetical protein [Chloroflexaceae bacterium]
MRERLAILLTSACLLSIYLLTLTSVHTYDALSYILDVDRKPWPELFHPHHLAYGPLGALIRAAAAALGWEGSAERLLQVANALAGALGAAMLGAVATASGPRGAPWAGPTATLLLGASYAYWYYAVEVEVYTIAAVFLVACLGLLLALARDPSPRLAAALGAAQACAVLFHQTNVLLGVPALVALLLGARDRPRAAVARLLLAYALPLGLIVGGAYLWVGLGVSGFRSWGELLGWMAGYATTGLWGGPVGAEKLALLGRGLAESLAQPGGALVGLALLGTLLARRRGLRAAPRGAVAVCLSWLLVYGAFFLWWEPDNIEFWIASMPPFYLLVVLAAWGQAGERERGRPGDGEVGRARGWRDAWPQAVLLGCGLVMLALNWAAIGQRGDAERDLQRAVAAALAAGTAPGDLLVAPDGLVELYLPFYEGRDNVASLSQAMAATGGDWEAACALIRGRIDAALAGGYEARIAAEALRPPPAPPGQPPTPAERFGLGADQVAACYAPYAAAMEAVAQADEGLPGHYRIPGAQELAEGPGWDFTRLTWGWRAANAAPAPSALTGWALRPGLDPALSSPPLALDAGRFGAVGPRVAGDTARAQRIAIEQI